MKCSRVTGCTLSFSADCRDILSPLSMHWHHDEWIALLTSWAGWRPCLVGVFAPVIVATRPRPSALEIPNQDPLIWRWPAGCHRVLSEY